MAFGGNLGAPGCYPFSDRDPFILHETPDVYFIGNQPAFETRTVTSVNQAGKEQLTRVVLVPKFHETGQVVLVNTRTLDVKVVQFEV